ncbi:MAG: hypothetical protein D6806_15310 [Deltaproteobacteria bacterium]|nr:MAG: hypothetical protein D6806_15310 [Deltaproteobacteria bacterium]
MAKHAAADAERKAVSKPSRRRRPVPWPEVARLLAAGLTEAEVAELVGCEVRTLRARITRWGGLEQVVARYREECAENPRETYRRLVELVYAHLERQVRSGNLRVLLWVADRLKLVRPVEADNEPDPLEERLAALAEDDEDFDHDGP